MAVAAGVPAFGVAEWAVPRQQPVLYYGGEGGRSMHARRLQRVAEFYELPLGDLPLHLVTDVGSFNTDTFRDALRRNVEETGAGLVVLDSLYNYHPANVDAGNVYERGRLLSELSSLTLDLGCALWVVDHFNKTGSGIDLDRLAQAGMAAWADSWTLWEHAADPDVPQGRFTLNAGIGSRQWGGDERSVRLDIGAFDFESGRHLSPIKVDVSRGLTTRSGAGASGDDIAAALQRLVGDNPAQLTKVQAIKAVSDETGAADRRVRKAFSDLQECGLLREERAKVQEGSRLVTRSVWVVGDGKFRLRLATTAERRKP